MAYVGDGILTGQGGLRVLKDTRKLIMVVCGESGFLKLPENSLLIVF